MALISKRVRNWPNGFKERQAARDRLPGWAKFAQTVIWIPCWLGIAAAWAAIFLGLHHLLHPQHAETDSTASGIIMFSALISGIPLGMMLANAVLWIVPPLRRVNVIAAGDTPGANFKDATQDLFSVALLLVPAAAIAGIVAVWAPWTR
jgi:hypothetical protein